MMRFNIITLFPEMFSGPLTESIIQRAQEKKLIEIKFYQLRDFANDKHRTVDDTPYGGGRGMILKVDVIDRAIEKVKSENQNQTRIVLLSPRGRRYNQDIAKEFAQIGNITLICGHYEGVDERVYDLVDDVISIGDYVLTGGEIAAMAIVDSVARLIPGVIVGESYLQESFMQKDGDGNFILEHPHYTRPLEYKGQRVPEVLLSGNHAEIEKWRRQQAKIKSPQ